MASESPAQNVNAARTRPLMKSLPAETALKATLDKSYKSKVAAEEKALMDRHPKMAGKFEMRLIETVERLQRDGEEATRTALKNEGVILAGDGRDLAVIVFPDEDAPSGALRAAVEKAGATVIRQDAHTLKLAVPFSNLASLATVDGIALVRTLRPPRESSVTQGRTLTRADVWQTGGVSGAGVKIAVVDFSFGNYTTLQSQGELPASLTTVNYSAAAMNAAGSNHGSACAEVIYDMAPAANLILIKIDDITDLVTAASYCATNGVNVISCSLGFDGMSFHDGLAHQNVFSSVATHPITAVANATTSGALWVNSAGNEQRSYSLIDWRDADTDGVLDWTSASGNLNVLWRYDSNTQSMSTTIPAGVTLDIVLSWNQWPTTASDFDLLLLKNTGSGWTPITSFPSGYGGAAAQTGSATSYPFEEIIYQTTDASAQYAVAVAKFSSSTSPKFILRYYGADEPLYFGYGNTSTPEPGSLAIPADSASAFTVGALDQSTYTTGLIESFSSLGPNNRAFTGGTAVTKPDICGPDFVDTATFGATGFGGTSAATPHVAALAALARAAYPAMTLTELRNYLEAKAVDRGSAGKDNTYGAGAARMTSEAPPFVTAIDRAGASQALPGTVQFNVTFNKSVTGVTTSNFQLATTGISGPSITSVTGSGTTRTVAVNTGTGNGTVGLNMVNSTGVADSVTNAVAALPFTGQVFTIAANPDITLAVSPSSMAEDAAGTMVYTFTRSGATTSALTVNFSVSGTATLTTDYAQSGAASFSATTGTVSFAVGSATTTVAIDPVADATVEGNETIALTLASGADYNIASPSAATGTITNDDTDVSVTASTASAYENSGSPCILTFTRSGVTTGALTANFTVGGTATLSTDYAASSTGVPFTFNATTGSVTFGAGITSVQVSIASLPDSTVESDETVVLTVATGSGYTVAGSTTATATILNDDASINVAVSPTSMNEDAAGTMAFTFTLTGNTTGPLPVLFSVGGTASFGGAADYTQTGADSFTTTTGSVTFTPGQATAVVNIDPVADSAVESSETVVVTLSPGSYTVGSPSAATGTITNDDATPTVSVAVAPPSLTEDAAGSMAYTFTRSGPTTSALTANFSVSGTATFSTDYTQTGAATFGASSGTVTFAIGSSTAVINLDPTADSTVESHETAILTVTSGSGYTVGSPSAATGTIINDDTSISVAASPTSMAEDAAGTMALTFTRNGETSGALTVNFSVFGTATFGTDYTQSGATTFGASGAVSFSAGSSTVVVNIDPTSDTLYEVNETVVATVSSGSGYSVGSPASATVTINNDDNAPVMAWNAAAGSVAENTASTTIGATLSAVSGADAVAHVTVTGSAINGTDYEFAGLPLELFVTIPAGQTTANVTVNLINDALDETDETAILTMDSFSSVNATVGNPSVHTLTIIDDDNPEIAVEQPSGTNLVDGTASITFGSSNVGTPVVRTFTVRNTGTVALTGLAVTKDGTNSADYAVSSLPTSIAAGGSTTFDVTFTPSASGTRTAAIHIASNDADENPFDIQLTGSGAVTNPTSFADDFDPSIDTPIWSALGGTATADTFAQAAGPGSTGNSLRFDGAGSRFALTQVLNTQAGGSIGFQFALGFGTGSTWETAETGEEVVLEYTLDGGTTFVQFAGPFSHRPWQHVVVPIPLAAQVAAVQFRFRQLSNSGVGFDHWALDDVQIGTGVPTFAEIGIEQPSGTRLTDGTSTAAFASTTVGQSSILTFTIRNQGSASLTSIAASIDGANAADFTVSSLPATSLASAATTTFVVTFAPTTPGTRTAALHVASNDANENPFDITLTGTAVAPVPEIAVEQPSGTGLVDGASTKNFGTVILIGNSSLVFTVRNLGTAALSGIGVSISGANAADFTLTASPATSVAAAGSTTFTVRFAPSAIGVRNASLQISSNDADENPFDIALTGTGSTTGTYTLDAMDRGWYNPSGFHDPSNVNYLTGYNNTAPIVDHRSFFIFNLPILAPGETVVSAELRLDNPSGGYFSSDATETLLISEVLTNPATLAAGTGGTVAFQDLGDGTAFSSPVSVSAASNGTTVVIPLNGAFVSSIPPVGNATIALGGMLTSLQPSALAGEGIFGFSTNSQFTRLVITTSMPPEIVVEQPAGTDLIDGTATVSFAAAGTGLTALPTNIRTFTIRNTGLGSMTGMTISKDGASGADFSVGSLGATTLAPGSSTTFTVTFAPIGGTSGARTAAIHISNNDPDENPFDIALTGLALSSTLDTDNDGMNDWGEYQLAALGFDWQVANNALVNTYFAAANSNGLYTPGQVQALHIGAPLIQRSAGGSFTLTIGIDKSTDLTTWSPFPFVSPQTTIDGQGRVQFQFTVPDEAAFFRLQSQ